MPRYVKNYWSIRLARLAYRLERATAKAIEWSWAQDEASWHYEGRALTRLEEVRIWLAGFREGWDAASRDGHPWFERSAAVSANAIPGR